MLSSRPIYALTLSERHVIRRQWLRSGQCLRCFHASTSRGAEEKNRSQSTTQNASRRGPGRRQRSAMISDEIKMIQRDHPSPTFREPDPNTLRPAGAGQTVEPEAVGQNVAPGRMGHNDSPTQEGPLAQGVGRAIDADEDVQDTSKLARGARSPDDLAEAPVEGGPGVLNVGRESQVGDAPSAIQGDDASNGVVRDVIDDTTAYTERTFTKTFAQIAQSKPPLDQFREDLASRKYNSTIAGGRFESVIADHVSQAIRQAEPTRKMNREPTPPNILRKVVAGKYGAKHHFSGAALEQPALNEIDRATSMNGTYMPEDTVRFLSKVRSLLPPPQTKGARQPVEQGASEDA